MKDKVGDSLWDSQRAIVLVTFLTRNGRKNEKNLIIQISQKKKKKEPYT